jgi:hypothetical protein
VLPTVSYLGSFPGLSRGSCHHGQVHRLHSCMLHCHCEALSLTGKKINLLLGTDWAPALIETTTWSVFPSGRAQCLGENYISWQLL